MFSKILKRYFSKPNGASFKSSLSLGTPKFGIFLNSNSPLLAEQLSHSSFDWLLIDQQHSPSSIRELVPAIQNGESFTFTRIPDCNDIVAIQQARDIGIEGILIPYVKTKEDVQRAIGACYYPDPERGIGSRSIYFPQRASNKKGLVGYLQSANENIVTAIQVETKECLENIEDICTIPELDIVFIGRGDLALNLGLVAKYGFPGFLGCDEMNESIQRVKEACEKNNKSLGIFLIGTKEVKKFLEMGFRFICVGCDLDQMIMANSITVGELKGITKKVGLEWEGQDSNLIM